MTSQKVIEYPTGLSGIPYASFLEVKKMSYDEAMRTVAQNQNDAFGAYTRSRISGAVKGVAELANNAYGSGDWNARNKSTEKFASADDDEQGFLGIGRKYYTLDGDPDQEVELENGEITTLGALAKEKEEKTKAKLEKGLLSSFCHLPLPNEFQYKYGADWSNEFKLGTLALAADNIGRFTAIAATGAAAGGGGAFALDKLTSATSLTDVAGKVGGVNIDKIVGGAAKGAGTAINAFGVNRPLNPKHVAGLAGLAPNENSIQFFERMQGREFSFRFELAARNKKESSKVEAIIEWFKRGMHPNAKNGKGSAVLLTFPDVFLLTPKFVKCNEQGVPVPNGIVQHPMMPKTKLCALTGLTINTTPFGQLQTVFDGTIPMVTMELMFKETTKLTRVDMEGAAYTDRTGSAALFKSKNLPKIAATRGTFIRDTDDVGNANVTY